MTRPKFFRPNTNTPRRTDITKTAQARQLAKQQTLVDRLSEPRGQAQRPLAAKEIVTTASAPIPPPPIRK